MGTQKIKSNISESAFFKIFSHRLYLMIKKTNKETDLQISLIAF
jgi:hypothetical protein